MGIPETARAFTDIWQFRVSPEGETFRRVELLVGSGCRLSNHDRTPSDGPPRSPLPASGEQAHRRLVRFAHETVAALGTDRSGRVAARRWMSPLLRRVSLAPQSGLRKS